jgi:hypothetical protein
MDRVFRDACTHPTRCIQPQPKEQILDTRHYENLKSNGKDICKNAMMSLVICVSFM